MRIVVTGGAGYIGSITTELLLDAGNDVVVFDNLERGHRAAIDGRAGFVQGDLRDRRAIGAAMAQARPDAVMHFAAYALVGESMEKPELYFGNNVGGLIHLADAMREYGTRRIVFSSTCATYGMPEKVPITEEESQKPANPYGESKLMCERVLEWYGRLHGFQVVRLRYFNAAGATEKFGEDHEPESHLIPNLLRVALGRLKELRIFGEDYPTPDGTCIRDYIHIADLARAHMLALEKNFSGALNLGTGTGFSVREVLDMARAVTGHPIPASVSPRRPGDPARLVAASDRARAALGWVPQRSDLRSIVESAWAWTRLHPQGYQ